MKPLISYINEATKLNDAHQNGFDHGFSWNETIGLDDVVNCVAWTMYGFADVCKSFNNTPFQEILKSGFDKLSKIDGFNKNANCKKGILDKCENLNEEYTDAESIVYIQGAIDGFLGSIKNVNRMDDDGLKESGIEDISSFRTNLEKITRILQQVRMKYGTYSKW